MPTIQKIKAYNQILLAIAGTFALLFAILLAIIFLIEISGGGRSDDYQDGILATEQTDELLKDSLRRQIISFDQIQIIDSISQTYLLPVAQANLVDPERANDLLGLTNNFSMEKKYYKNYHNVYNNLLIHHALLDTTKLVFEQRISIEDFKTHTTTDRQQYLLITGCSVDSNQDKILDEEDLQELFVYDIKREQLTKIEADENYTTLHVYQPPKSTGIVVHFGIDRNNNGAFESRKEPMVFYKLDVPNRQLRPFASETQTNRLQHLLEGR